MPFDGLEIRYEPEDEQPPRRAMTPHEALCVMLRFVLILVGPAMLLLVVEAVLEHWFPALRL